ncbi:DUF3604 domain-containing protein, partial [Mesorhizobium sp. M00.F.Ca.ET.186.01.1.1]
GDLTAAPEGKVPTFLVAALKDPIGANLDRYQIVKGWLDDKDQTHEQVYDVAWGGDRKLGADGKLPSVGSTVDVENATWKNTTPEIAASFPCNRADAVGKGLALRIGVGHRDQHHPWPGRKSADCRGGRR